MALLSSGGPARPPLRLSRAQALFRVAGRAHGMTGEGAGPGLRKIAVPYLIRPPAHRYTFRLTPAFGVKEAKLDPFRVFGKEGKIHTLSVPGSPHWVRLTAPHRCFRAIHQERQRGRKPSEGGRHPEISPKEMRAACNR